MCSMRKAARATAPGGHPEILRGHLSNARRARLAQVDAHIEGGRGRRGTGADIVGVAPGDMMSEQTMVQGPMTTLATTGDETAATVYHRLAAVVVAAAKGPTTRRDRARALREFLAWWAETGAQPIDKAMVQRYITHMVDVLGYAATNTNPRLASIKKLAVEVADYHTVAALSAQDPTRERFHRVCETLASRVSRAKGVTSRGVRTGNWLTKAQAEALLEAPDSGTVKGKRDRALLAVFVGCGLRRSEVASLTFGHIEQRDGRWAIVDMIGKGSRVRSVAMPAWCKARIDAWAKAAGIDGGHVFRPVNKGGRLVGNKLGNRQRAQLSGAACYDVVRFYAARLHEADSTFPPALAAHDLRRSYAKLGFAGQRDMEQMQFSLGHSSITTTQRYIGSKQHLGQGDAPCDHLGLTVGL